MGSPQEQEQEQGPAQPSPSPNTVLPYTTDSYAEFYDLWCDSLVVGRHAPDEEVYWNAIHTLIPPPPQTQQHAINVVEIGTGSGRCLKDLFERAHNTGVSFPNVHFYGIDPSAPMLKRARAWFDARPALKQVAARPIEWVEALGEDFIDAQLPRLRGACDLVMWTGGGFSHLCSEGQQRSFLRQMFGALRGGGGGAARGIVLVYDQSIPSRMSEAASEVFEIPWEGRSEEDPRVVYRKSGNEVSWEGPVRRDRWDVGVWREGVEVWREKVDHLLMNLDEERWPGLVREAGLSIEREEELEGMGVFFFLKKAE
ncbi:hypothetical protein MMC28_003496 [Mycoblastus sanguinarius]|nr:hypothetical protein [Mycoblastus sanguinarius]